MKTSTEPTPIKVAWPKVELPSARAIPRSRLESLQVSLGKFIHWFASKLWRLRKWIPRLGILLVVVLCAKVFISYEIGQSRKYAAEAKAKCAGWNNVRIEPIVKLREIERQTESGRIIRGWRVFTQIPGSSNIDVHENTCTSKLIVDVPKGKPLWAWQTSRMRDDVCNCFIEYHIHSMADTTKAVELE
jgi:hypothetical protein